MHPAGEIGNATVPAFLSKLWTLVDDPNTDEYIAWDSSGQSFHVFDQARFSKEVLPMFFKHSNIASFIRQLNMYGFRKIMNVEQGGLKVEKDDMEFAHQHFLRDNEHLLEYIKRKVSTSKPEEVKFKPDDVNRVLNDVRSIKGKQDNMSSKFDTLKRENEALWREVANLRQKHMKQQQIVNKLIQFLITLVGNKRPLATGVKRKMPLMLLAEASPPPQPPKIARQLTIQDGLRNPSPPAYTVISPPESVSAPSVQDSPYSLAAGTPEDVTTVYVPELVETSPLPPPGTATEPMMQIHDVTGIHTQLPTVSTGASIPQLGSQHVVEPAVASTGPAAQPTGASVYLEPLAVQNPQAGLSMQELLLQLTGATPTPPAISSAAVTAPTSTQPAPSTSGAVVIPDRTEVADHVETLTSDLESLKGLMASGQFSLDSSTLLGLFTPEAPLPPTPNLLNLTEEGGVLPDIFSSSTSDGTIAGHEVVQYNQPEDIMSLFDFGDMSETSDLLDPMATMSYSNSNLDTPKVEIASPLAARRKNRAPTEDID